MSKQKSAEQCKVFLNFMEEHPDIAKGFSRGDRVKQDELWNNLAKQLNASGPPTRDVTMWKKTWFDWRRSIKTRLPENKASIKKTGGGDFQQHYLSPVEEQLAIICGIFQAVDGISMAKTFGSGNKVIENVKICKAPQQELPLETILQTTDIPEDTQMPSSAPEICVDSSAHKRKRKRLNGDIQNIMTEEKQNFEYVAAKIEQINETLKDQTRYLRNLNKNIDELRSTKKKELEEIKRHQSKMEKIAMERNELKLEFLKLEKLKMGIIDD